MSAFPDVLEFLKRQRWFGAKGAEPESARIVDSVRLPWGDGRFSLTRAVVSLGGTEQWYQLVTSNDSLDAVGDESFRRGLVNAVAHGARLGDDHLRWIAEPIAISPIDGETRVGGAEQSNTSIVVGDKAIVKLFRLLRPGVHPDVEVTRFLTTRTEFQNTPRLLGVARFEDDEGEWTAAMMQELVAGATDAWSYALDRGREYFTAPKGKDAPNVFVADARRLGEVTRAMHDALASDDEDPAFAPEPVEPEDLDRWAQRTKQTVRDTVQLLEKQSSPEAQALMRRRDHYLGWIDEIDDALVEDAGVRIRVHGDYHLGQVLRAPSGEFLVIDFEGEPSRSLEERREKTSPLRDVAGMLRSFAYAAATLAMSVQKQLDVPTREVRVARWERDVRAAFLEGYLASSDEEEAGVLPEDPAHVKQLIALFEMEKAFYELAYELNNRPLWAWIPMRGISKLATA